MVSKSSRRAEFNNSQILIKKTHDLKKFKTFNAVKKIQKFEVKK